MNTLSLNELLARRVFLPSNHVVYVLFKGDSIVYVGQTAQLPQRLAAHLNRGIDFDSYSIVEVPHENTMCHRDAEAAYIRAYSPPLNAVHHPERKRPIRRWSAAEFMAKHGTPVASE